MIYNVNGTIITTGWDWFRAWWGIGALFIALVVTVVFEIIVFRVDTSKERKKQMPGWHD